MALIIERVLDTRFTFQYNGGAIISSDQNRMFTDGNYVHFKTATGANIIREQNLTYADVTVIDTFGGTGTFTFANITSLWNKLIQLKFFIGLGSLESTGIDTFIELTDTPTYFGNNGKTLIINEAENRLDAVPFYNINQITQLSDVEISSLTNNKILGVNLFGGIPKVTLVDKPADGTVYFSAVGGFNYHDLITHTTPLAYTSGDLQLTNDIDGSKTFLSKPPYGVTSVWDETDNVVDLSQLSIGDKVDLSISLLVTTSSANQTSNIKLLLGEGTADEETILIETFYTETAAETAMSGEIGFMVKNNNQKNTPAKILFSSDASATIKVEGFNFYIIRKSINLTDINIVGDSDKPPYIVATEGQTVFPIPDPTASNIDIHVNGMYAIEGDETYDDYKRVGNNAVFNYGATEGDRYSFRTYTNSDSGLIGTGTVTSVAVTGSDGIEIDSGSPITTSGTIALGINASNLKSHLAYTEEDILGTCTENLTTTGASDLDVSLFSSHFALLTGNTVHTLTGLPASGKSVVKTWIVRSTATETYSIANADKAVGEYLADGTDTRVTAEISIFPTIGQYIVVTYENLG